MAAFEARQEQARGGKRTGYLRDLSVTLLLWIYYTLGFVVFYAPFYLLAYLFSKDTAKSFQKLNSRFYRVFFNMLRRVVPACRWHIDANVRNIRSSIIVCNHISYLDPILLISLYPRHTTIAKSRLFTIPLYGTMLDLSGYLPSTTATGRLADLMLRCMQAMKRHLADGGNLIIFPEGTRGRNGHIGPLNKGAFKIARLCRAPVKVLRIENTNKLFRPGRFLFDTRTPNTVTVELLAEINPDYDAGLFSVTDLMQRVHTLLKGSDPIPASAD